MIHCAIAMFGIEQTGRATIRTSFIPTRRFDPGQWLSACPAGEARVRREHVRMRGGDNEDQAADISARAWMHRQNIERYRNLLQRESNRESHEQIEKLILEEEEKLRSLDGA